jgi:hypothetical protein
MVVRYNCKFNDGPFCKNKKVERSLFGLGARLCVMVGMKNHNCIFCESNQKPNIKPGCQKLN